MNVQVSFNGGTTIREACTETKDFAVKLNLEWVEFKFNEISCSISQRADIDKLCELYFKANSKESKYKFIID